MTCESSRVRRGRRGRAMGVLLIAGLLAIAGAAGAEEYRLGPRDVVEVVVFGQPELTGKFTLRSDGAFEFPLVGDVKVAGMTASEVQTRLRELLGNGFLTNPQVSTKIIEFNSQRVFVVGEVGRAGEVKLTGSLTLLEALSEAGGIAKTAGPELVVLRRTGQEGQSAGPLVLGQPGVQELSRVILDDLQAGRARDNVALTDGDTIFVPKAQVIYVTGEVLKPGALIYERGITVLEAISLAGGVTKVGSKKGARIIRIVDGQQRELKTKPTDVLQPGDIVEVRTRLF